MSDELKPCQIKLHSCPFCGGEAVVTKVNLEPWNRDWVFYGVRCLEDYQYGDSQHGHFIGGYKTEAEAIAAWNTRADDAPEQPQVITNAESYKLADDSRPQVITSAEKHESADKPDTRERLEEDVAMTLDAWLTGDIHELVLDSVVIWLDRQEAITRAEVFRDGEYDCMTCAAKAELRELVNSLTAERDELKHKQLVIDRQRDSFAKMEREYRELQDVCGELERTIENLRGD